MHFNKIHTFLFGKENPAFFLELINWNVFIREIIIQTK